MFQEIPPSKQGCYNKVLKPGFEILETHSLLSTSFPNYEKGTVLLFGDETKELMGGALLLQQTFASIHPKIQPNIRHLLSKNNTLWTGTVFLCEKNHKFSRQYEFLCKTFYYNLYQKLVEFGQKEEIRFLYMILSTGEFLCTEEIGLWPYVYTLHTGQPFQDISYKILSLVTNQTNASPFYKMTSDSSALNLAACVSQVNSRQVVEGSICSSQ